MKNRRRIDSRSAVLKIVPTRVDQGAQLQSTLDGCIVSTASIKVFRAVRRARNILVTDTALRIISCCLRRLGEDQPSLVAGFSRSNR